MSDFPVLLLVVWVWEPGLAPGGCGWDHLGEAVMDWEKMPWKRGAAEGSSRLVAQCRMRGQDCAEEPGMSRDPEFPAVPSAWSHLDSDSCLSQERGCVPSALLPVLWDTGTAPGAGTGLTAPLVPPMPCRDHGKSLGMGVPEWGSPCAHTLLELLGG